jgi:hypothetical protein
MPNEGNVAAFACNKAHPQIKDAACVRARHHPGDHQTTAAGTLKTWQDWGVPGPPTAEQFLEEAKTAAQAGPMRLDWYELNTPTELDEDAETFDLDPVRSVWSGGWPEALLMTLAVCAVMAAPALLVLLYAAAIRAVS